MRRKEKNKGMGEDEKEEKMPKATQKSQIFINGHILLTVITEHLKGILKLRLWELLSFSLQIPKRHEKNTQKCPKIKTRF